jgi:hypothetical protein
MPKQIITIKNAFFDSKNQHRIRMVAVTETAGMPIRILFFFESLVFKLFSQIIIVVLPQPDGPKRTTNSWSAISKLKLLTATTSSNFFQDFFAILPSSCSP